MNNRRRLQRRKVAGEMLGIEQGMILSAEAAIKTFDNDDLDSARLDFLRGQIGARHEITAVAIKARDAIGDRIQFLNVERATHGIGDEPHSLIFAERRRTGDAHSPYIDGHVDRIWQSRPSFDRQFDLRHRRNGGAAMADRSGAISCRRLAATVPVPPILQPRN